MTTRTLLLAGALLAGPLTPVAGGHETPDQAGAAATQREQALTDDFAYGVAAGRVTATSAILWTRAGRPGTIAAELVADGGSWRRARRLVRRARPQRDHTVHATFTRLRPATAYRYRFRRGRLSSEEGRFTTAPAPDADVPVRFAFTGDADATPLPGADRPALGDFSVMEAMRAERNHFNLLNGDTIFSDSVVGGRVVNLDIEPLFFAQAKPDKWAKYRQTLRLRAHRDLRASSAFEVLWDDHEFDNDFTIPEGGRPLYEAGRDAFRDYQPVRVDPRLGLYRRLRWGRHLEVFLLDARSFSSAKASAGGVCDNPDTGRPDQLPTAPPSVRLRFGAFQRPLLRPVAPACLAAIADPSRTLLGAEQRERFLADVAASDATFKVVVTQPLHQFYTGPYDRWEGYAHERRVLLEHLRDRARNVVVLSNDSHANFVNEVRLQTLEPGGPVPTGITEIATGPNAAQTHAGQIRSASGSELGPSLVRALLYEPEPPAGVGIECAAIDVRSYGEVVVSARRLVVQLKDAAGRTVLDGEGRPCASVSIPAEPGWIPGRGRLPD